MSAKVRCAIYTRKSTEEGLDQQFNSLDAQREACEAYVQSQAGEGWRALAERYDDGGFSGGNLDRPEMQKLLRDVDVGKVDVIVVYKVDRLTRSLMDFSKIVERLDARGVSFVSVTQAFNTTTSMGRLTLNVLLSFAQFEREVTGERIRDKIAASKAKGMWMGGNVPLGYDLLDRDLIINPAEAEQVRFIFRRFLELGSGVRLIHELREKGITSKRWVARSGRNMGGVPFRCGVLYYLLQNRLYLGEVVHRGIHHQGRHEPILPIELFEAVQEKLASARGERRERSTRTSACHLAGLVYDAAGQTLRTSFSHGRGGKLYRYYVLGSLDPARPDTAVRPLRVPAGPLERTALRAVQRLSDEQLCWTEALRRISRIELHKRSIHIVLSGVELLEPHEPVTLAAERLRARAEGSRIVADEQGNLRLILDRSPSFRGGASARSVETSSGGSGEQLTVLKRAHELLASHRLSPLHPELHRQAKAPQSQRQRRAMILGLLSPTIQKSIALGRIGQGPSGDMEMLPLAWADQSS